MISILMPIYNGVEFIEESVSSIIGQTYQTWELIIGINGHPENSNVYQIAKKYEKMYPHKIRVFDFYQISGKSNTLNEMILHCNYPYVALLDVDDIWNENKLEIQSVYIDKYDVIGSRCIYFGDMEGIVPYIPIGDIIEFPFLSSNPIINSSSIIRKELCYWKTKYEGIEDYDLWLRLFYIQKRTFYNFNEILVKHRIHQTSAFNAKGQTAKLNELIAEYEPFTKTNI